MAVLKVIEVMANSATSWEEATQNAVSHAARNLNNIKSVYVNEQSAQVKDGKVTDYRVNVKITFEVN